MWCFRKIKLYFALLAIFSTQISCGFQPLYTNLPKSADLLGQIRIAQIDGKEGFHLREDLVRRFGNPRADAYILDIALTTSKSKELITPTNDITSYLLIMKARYTLKDATGDSLINEQFSEARTGFNSAINSTGYATQVAEDSAIRRLSLNISEKINTKLLVLRDEWL